MPPADRFVPRFAAEPPQEDLPYGRWEAHLREEFTGAVRGLDTAGAELGEAGDVVWYPDRSWHGRTYVPATAPTANGYELFGYVRFLAAGEDREPSEFSVHVDFTDETAARNPAWQLDLCDEVIGAWRGESGEVASMTLVWGHPLIAGGRVATAELAALAVDQCELINERFTLIAPDDYRHDLLEIALFDGRGRELARDSLYSGEEEEDGDSAASARAEPDGAAQD